MVAGACITNKFAMLKSILVNKDFQTRDLMDFNMDFT